MPAEEDYEGLSSLAERLGLDDDEKEGFIASSMKRLGYVSKALWEDAPSENGGGGGGGDFFSKRREAQQQQPRQRQVSNGRRPPASNGGGGSAWGYGS